MQDENSLERLITRLGDISDELRQLAGRSIDKLLALEINATANRIDNEVSYLKSIRRARNHE